MKRWTNVPCLDNRKGLKHLNVICGSELIAISTGRGINFMSAVNGRLIWYLLSAGAEGHELNYCSKDTTVREMVPPPPPSQRLTYEQFFNEEERESTLWECPLAFSSLRCWASCWPGFCGSSSGPWQLKNEHCHGLGHGIISVPLCWTGRVCRSWPWKNSFCG